ncbi:hypothetical protein IB229_01040 [Pseudomonas sp. PDM14]|uniref:hypothetical protein n=1 Tax=Pseudomonas sp. PDM14 TaxID=2769288 RepID=UPI00177F8431|nr:hypothetical protein [Pseudomonas sp. PDM14]MBD9481542.1 hypothetical protein [Pseudomonas sp. PDM14]
MKLLLALLPVSLGSGLMFAPPPGDPLRDAYLVSSKRLNCLDGDWQLQRGNSPAAISAYEQCVAKWNDIYSMLRLSHLYRDDQPARAADLLVRAEQLDAAQAAYWRQRLAAQDSR